MKENKVVKNVVPEKNILKSYIVLFKVEGHETWRANFYPRRDGFESYLKFQPKHPKVTEEKWFTINKLTGEIIPE